MTGSKDLHLAELHSMAAYAHALAAHANIEGNPTSAQELARQALGYSMEAVKRAEEVAAKHAPQSMQV
jgi:hypothetical protein